MNRTYAHALQNPQKDRASRAGRLAAVLGVVALSISGSVAALAAEAQIGAGEEPTAAVYSLSGDESDVLQLSDGDGVADGTGGSAPATEAPADPSTTPGNSPESTTAPSSGDEGTPTEQNPPQSDGLEAKGQPDEPEVQEEADEEVGMMPFVVGTPDGGNPPYVYWVVKDTDGNLVPGATFKFEYRSGGWQTGSNASAISDCNGTCSTNTNGNVLDRDSDGGEFLLEHRGTDRNSGNRIVAGSRYRVTPVAAPAGYEWVSTSSVDSNNKTWVGTGNNPTLDFGTFEVKRLSGSITVKKADWRSESGAASETNRAGQNTQGARFALYSTQTATDPIAGYTNPATSDGFCEIASNGGDCVFQNVPVGTYWVGEIAPKSGSSAASSYEPPIGKLNTGTASNNSLQNYRYQVTVTNNGNATAPATNAASSGAFANRLTNPSLQVSCEAGVKVAIVLDVSGSITNASKQNDLAKATTAFINSLVGTPSQVALFSFSTASPGTTWGSSGNTTTKILDNYPTLTSVQTQAQADAVIARYSTNNGQAWKTPNPSGGTNWDSAFWTASQANTTGNHYDLVFVLTDGNPTFAGTTAGTGGSTSNPPSGLVGNGSTTTFREIEWGVYSSNRIKDQNTRVVGVGVGNGVTAENLASFTGDNGWVAGKSLNEVDYITANWDQLATLLKDFAKGLACEAGVTVQKLAAEGNATPAPATGWEFTTTATKGTVSPGNPQPTAGSGATASWGIKFSNVTDEGTVTITETQQTGWSLESLACTVNDAPVEVTQNGTAATIAAVGVGDQVKCVFTNRKAQFGELTITKAFEGSVPTGPGTNTVFNGTYSCELPADDVVASGTWTRTGTGAATLTPASGSPAVNQIPAGASCSATETQPTGSDGLPNSSWEWDTYSVDGPVTVEANKTAQLTVTNKAKRVYGNFQITKQVEGNADGNLTFGGDWTCTLGTDTEGGTWGPIGAGQTWDSATVHDNKIPLGATCTATETTPTGGPVSGKPWIQWDDVEITPVGGVAAAKDASAATTITVKNKTKTVLGSVEWSKVDSSGAALAGSEWRVTGPEDTNLTVSESACTGVASPEGAPYCTYTAIGAFEVHNLVWGNYTLSETKPPVGYQPIADRNFTIGEADTLHINLGPITNKSIDGPNLPLTGGQAAATFAIVGGGLLAGALALAHLQRRKGRAL